MERKATRPGHMRTVGANTHNPARGGSGNPLTVQLRGRAGGDRPVYLSEPAPERGPATED